MASTTRLPGCCCCAPTRCFQRVAAPVATAVVMRRSSLLSLLVLLLAVVAVASVDAAQGKVKVGVYGEWTEGNGGERGAIRGTVVACTRRSAWLRSPPSA